MIDFSFDLYVMSVLIVVLELSFIQITIFYIENIEGYTSKDGNGYRSSIAKMQKICTEPLPTLFWCFSNCAWGKKVGRLGHKFYVSRIF
jgi:hypothetical protein